MSIKICTIKPNDLPQPYLHLPIKGSCKGQAPSQSLAKDKKVKMKFQIVVLLCLAAALKADVSFSKQSVSSKPLMYFRWQGLQSGKRHYHKFSCFYIHLWHTWYVLLLRQVHSCPTDFLLAITNDDSKLPLSST